MCASTKAVNSNPVPAMTVFRIQVGGVGAQARTGGARVEPPAAS